MQAFTDPFTGERIGEESTDFPTTKQDKSFVDPFTGETISYRIDAPVPPTPTDELTDSVSLADYGKSIMSGGAGVAQGVGWLLEKYGDEDWGDDGDYSTRMGRAIKDLGSNAVDYWNESLSDGAKNELSKEFVTKDENGEWQWGDASLKTVGLYGAQSLLGTAAGMGAGAGITKALQFFGNPIGRGALLSAVEAGSAKGATAAAVKEGAAAAKKLKLVDRVLGATGFGLGEGGVGGMMTGVNVEEQIMSLDADKLMSSPRFMEIYDAQIQSGIDPETALASARETLAKEGASTAGYQAGLTTALLGAPMGAFFGPLFSRAGLRNTSRLAATGIGAAGEAAQEFAQSGFEAYTTNEALIAAGDPRDIWQDVLNQAVGGAAAGAAMGGAFGAAGGADPVDVAKKEAKQTKKRAEDIRTNYAPLEKIGIRAVEAGVPKEEIDKVLAEVPDGGVAQAAKQLRELVEQHEAGEAETPTVEEALADVDATRPKKKGKRKRKTEAEAQVPPLDDETVKKLDESRQAAKEEREAPPVAPPTEFDEPTVDTSFEDKLKEKEIEDKYEEAGAAHFEAAGYYDYTREEAIEQGREVAVYAGMDDVVEDAAEAELSDRRAAAQTQEDVAAQAHEAAESPENDLKPPTDAQKAYGNYKKGKVKLAHLPEMLIENPEGSDRHGNTMTGIHYGYFPRTEGADNENDGTPREGVDVMVNSTEGATDEDRPVFVINQVNEDGSFDEHKVMVGFTDEAAARKAYEDQYDADWRGFDSAVEMTAEEFSKWVKDPANTSKAAGAPAQSQQFDAYKSWIDEVSAETLGESPGTLETIRMDERLEDGEAKQLEALWKDKTGQGLDPEKFDIKYDLAKAYVDMGDNVGAVDILNEILSEGSAEQRQQAQEVLDTVPTEQEPPPLSTPGQTDEIPPQSPSGATAPTEVIISDEKYQVAIDQTYADGQRDVTVTGPTGKTMGMTIAPNEVEANAAAKARAHWTYGDEKKQVSSPLERLREQVVVFASGMSRTKDLDAGTRAWGGLQSRGIGVDVGEVSLPGIRTMANAIVNKKAQVFIDSGAFSLFRRNMKHGDTKALDFDAVFKKYDRILEEVANLNAAEEDIRPPLMVMPDVVGDQATSLLMVDKYANRIATEASFDVARPIIPIQKGDLSLSDAYSAVVEKLGTDNFIVGVPANSAAISVEEFSAFVAESKPNKVHFLGAASDKRLAPYLEVLADANMDMQHLSADANILRNALYGKVPEGVDRHDAMVDTLVDRAGPEFTEALEGPDPSADIVADQEFGDLELTYEVEVEETGEMFSITEDANLTFKRAVKRRDNLQKLVECVRG